MPKEPYCKNCKHLVIDKNYCEVAEAEAIAPIQTICKMAGWKEVGGRYASDSKSTGDWATYLEKV